MTTIATSGSGTQTATIGTEHSLVASDTTQGIYYLNVDTTNLADVSEIVELRLYVKVKSGAAFVQTWKGSFHGGEVDVGVQSINVPIAVEIKATLTQITGTGRAFDWGLYRM